jgi:hypothetical protein
MVLSITVATIRGHCGSSEQKKIKQVKKKKKKKNKTRTFLPIPNMASAQRVGKATHVQ